MFSPEQLPRYFQRLFSGKDKDRESRRIIVVREKHGDRYFKADTLEAACQAALHLLRERYGPGGDYGHVDDFIAEFEEDQITKPDIEKDQISSIQSETLRKQAEEMWETYERRKSQNDEYLRMMKHVQKARVENDQIRALYAFWLLRDGEYEGWDFEYLEKIEFCRVEGLGEK